MDNKLIITPKGDTYVVLTVRTESWVRDEYDKLADKTNRSRNELMSMGLKYALEHMEIVGDTYRK